MQEAFYGKEVVIADREMVESRIEVILDGADKEDVAFLVVGDPFGCAAATLSLKPAQQTFVASSCPCVLTKPPLLNQSMPELR